MTLMYGIGPSGKIVYAQRGMPADSDIVTAVTKK